VNDGSTDETESVISQFSDPRIKLISHTKNKGASAARNTGIRAALGTYIAFLDSDDRWLPEKLRIQIEFLNRSPGYGSCSTGYFKYKPGQGFLPSIPSKPESDWLKHLLITMDLSFGTTLVVKRSCFDKVGLLDEEFPRHEDWDWVLRYIIFFQHNVIEIPLVEIIRSYGVDPEKIEKANTRLLEKHYAQFYQFGNWYGRRVEARRWIEVAQAYFNFRNTGKGIKFLFKAFRLYPFQTAGTFVSLVDSVFGTKFHKEIKNALN
jgi:glycosyltransferase involved in cell wall biosynthesis